MSAALPTTSRHWVLASRPEAEPTAENFRLESAPLPEPQGGQILVKNRAVSVDPYMRGRMNDVKSYVPPFAIGAPLDGGAVGEVVASETDTVPVGSVVTHSQGWRDYAVLDAAKATVVDASLAAPEYFLGVLGMPGITAYVGLIKVAQFKSSDVVFVSGAAGAVGSVVGQIAKAKGARAVIGSAGSAEKVEYLKSIGFDAAFNYNDAAEGRVTAQLAEALSDVGAEGVDVYFDNVGGEHLEAAIATANHGARIAMCGAISQYNLPSDAKTSGPSNMALAIGKEITLKGFIVGSYWQFAQEAAQFLAPMLAEGTLNYALTRREGLENAPQAFIDMLNGANTGKMVVELD